MSKEIISGYGTLLADIKRRVRAAQYAALRTVNKELVTLYWDIGRLIVERQGSAWHGDAIAERLALDLRAEFPGITGFSRRNIFYMRQFYLVYHADTKVQPLVAQIAWSQNLIVLQRCKEPHEREFYLRMAAKHGWSKITLALHITGGTFRKYLDNQTNFQGVMPRRLLGQAKLAVKDEYAFDFLELGEEHSEKELERALDLTPSTRPLLSC